ncbi:hypothetical protein ILUMI_05601, partial [Ignelater luminosus]
KPISEERDKPKSKENNLTNKKNEKIAILQKKLGKYRKRLARLEGKNKKNINDTPNTKMQKMLGEPDGRKEVVKKALFGDVLNKQLQENYSKLHRIRDQQVFSKVVHPYQLISQLHKDLK